MTTMRTPINEVWSGTPNWHPHEHAAVEETTTTTDTTTAEPEPAPATATMTDLQRMAAGLDADLGAQLDALEAVHHRWPQSMSLSEFAASWCRGSNEPLDPYAAP